MSRLGAGLGAVMLAWSVLAAGAPPPAQAAAASPAAAGTVTMVIGQGTALAPDGTVRALARGSAVYSGEVLNTAPNSYVNLKFTDGGLTMLRPNTRFEISDYVHVTEPADAPVPAAAGESTSAPAPPAAGDAVPAPLATAPAAAGSRAFFRLLRGGFRTVTGAIGKGETRYNVRTPTATIGIRGTDYYVVLCDAACAASDPSLQNGAGGVLVGVIEGGVFVANDAGASTDVGPEQYLLTLPDGTQITLPYEPKFISVDPIPDPQSCQ